MQTCQHAKICAINPRVRRTPKRLQEIMRAFSVKVRLTSHVFSAMVRPRTAPFLRPRVDVVARFHLWVGCWCVHKAACATPGRGCLDHGGVFDNAYRGPPPDRVIGAETHTIKADCMREKGQDLQTVQVFGKDRLWANNPEIRYKKAYERFIQCVMLLPGGTDHDSQNHFHAR
jgi:hypothetical protein